MFHFCLRLEITHLSQMVYCFLLVPPFFAGVNRETDAIIKDHFLHGFSYKEILEFLEIFMHLSHSKKSATSTVTSFSI